MNYEKIQQMNKRELLRLIDDLYGSDLTMSDDIEVIRREAIEQFRQDSGDYDDNLFLDNVVGKNALK